MSHPPKKTVFDFLVKLAPKPTAADEAEARRLGVEVDTYRATRLEVQVQQARQEHAAASDVPADIAAEQAEAQRLHRDPGLIKPRNLAPNLLVQAAKTPGEVARTILFVFLYVAGLAGVVVAGGERVQQLPGIFQCGLLALLILPVWWATDRIWAAIGEGARDALRALVRFWPLTLAAGFFALVLLKALAQQLRP